MRFLNLLALLAYFVLIPALVIAPMPDHMTTADALVFVATAIAGGIWGGGTGAYWLLRH